MTCTRRRTCHCPGPSERGAQGGRQGTHLLVRQAWCSSGACTGEALAVGEGGEWSAYLAPVVYIWRLPLLVRGLPQSLAAHISGCAELVLKEHGEEGGPFYIQAQKRGSLARKGVPRMALLPGTLERWASPSLCPGSQDE